MGLSGGDGQVERGGGVRCLDCGGEMEEIAAYASYVPANDDEMYWRCLGCGFRLIPEFKDSSLAVSRKNGEWRLVPRGCLLVMGGLEES